MLAFAAIFFLAWTFVVVNGGPVDVKKQGPEKPASGLFSWDPKNPPLWTIRPEDREIFKADKVGYLERQQENPCVNKEHAARLYKQYWEEDCPAKYRLNPDGSCQGWKNVFTDCTGFCQIRTYFEWAREVPFPNSECHAPIKCEISVRDSTRVGWSINLTGKIGKAAKVGVSGGLSGNWGTSHGRSWTINLDIRQCGYFTWIPVRKVVCGTVSFAILKRPVLGWNWCDTNEKHGAHSHGNICGEEMWMVRDDGRGQNVPDGTLIFVYTDCMTREPLPMEKQDPIYAAPGVALDSKSIQSRLRDSSGQKRSSPQSTCSIAKIEAPGEKRVTISGWGFSDDKIGSKGENLLQAVQRCTEVTVTKSRFNRHKSEDAPDGSLAQKGGYEFWIFSADVPARTPSECVNEMLFAMGGPGQNRCTE